MNAAPPIEAMCAELLTPTMFRRWLTTERAVYADIAHTPWAWAARWVDTAMKGIVVLGTDDPVLFTVDRLPARRIPVGEWLARYARLPRTQWPVSLHLDRTGALERLAYIVLPEEEEATP